MPFAERRFTAVRRKDREVTDAARVEDVIRRCPCCRVGFNDGGEVYIVPLNLGYMFDDGALKLYFHGAKAGRKFDLIGRSPRVGFEMDTDYRLNAADMACGYSARFQSVIGNGVMTMVTEPGEKRRGLALLMAHATGRTDWQFDDKSVDAVAVFRLDVTNMSCKEHA